MDALTKSIRELCEKYDLTSISLSYHDFGWGAYVHWKESGCASSQGFTKTASEALSDAIKQAIADRSGPPEVSIDNISPIEVTL